MLLAIDDTDGPDGGCTTHVAHRILQALGTGATAGPPRLVRLFPANPWKTRGNAAVVLDLDDALDPEATLDQAFTLVQQEARVADGKGAGLALLEQAPETAWYERGVRGPVRLDEAEAELERLGARVRRLGTGRGLVGCLCASAWRPGELATWELISYRQPDRWGTPRQVDPAGLARIEASLAAVFDCIDPVDGHPAMVPRTPCPVLHGLRATAPDHLEPAAQLIGSEPVADRRLFLTNQASDDHLRAQALAPLVALERPESLRGGHVRLACRTEDGRPRACMAFEPTGRLRQALLTVQPGDRLLPVGDLRDGQIHLEKLLHVPAARRTRQPCPACGRAMSSAGRQAGVRCDRCGHRAPKAYQRGPARWHEADVSARRHLARPLALGLAPRVQAAAEALVADRGHSEDPPVVTTGLT